MQSTRLPGRFPSYQGNYSPPTCCSGTGGDRQGGLEPGIHVDAVGRTTYSGLSGESHQPRASVETVRAASTTTMDCSVPLLLEGSRSTLNQKGGNSKEGFKDLTSRKSSRSIRTGSRGVTKVQTEVSKEAESQGLSGGIAQRKPCYNDGELNVPHRKSPLINTGGLLTSGLLNNGRNGICPGCRHKLGGMTSCKACGYAPDSGACGVSSGPAVDSLCFAKWCSFLAVSVLRTRSPFASFLSKTLHLPRSSVVSSSPTFPLPIP